MGVRRNCAIALAAGLVSGALLSPVQAAGWDFDLTIDPTLSTLQFDIDIDTDFGSGSGSDSTAVTGTVGANLNLPSGSFNQIRITDMNVMLVDDLHFDFNVGFFTFIGNIVDGGLRMDATHGSPGPAVPVVGQNFNQTGNLASAFGEVDYSIFILSGDADLSEEDPSDLDFVGTVSVVSNQIRLSVPIDITFDLIQDGDDLGDARVHGTILAKGTPLKPGDSDGDGDVDLSDLSNLAASYGLTTNAQWGQGNFDTDNDVDLNDLATLAANYGLGEAQAFADFQALGVVPEPGAVAGIGVASLALLRRRRA